MPPHRLFLEKPQVNRRIEYLDPTGSAFGTIHGTAVRPRMIAWGAALVFIVFGVLATRRLSRALDHAVTSRTIPAAGAATRLVLSGVGYLIVIFGLFGILGVSMSHLLVCAGLAGVVLGIATPESRQFRTSQGGPSTSGGRSRR